MSSFFVFFFFNDTATTEIYTLSLHDALPISRTSATSRSRRRRWAWGSTRAARCARSHSAPRDRKSTRLNSSHSQISYAVFCLKKKKKKTPHPLRNELQRRPDSTLPHCRTRRY